MNITEEEVRKISDIARLDLGKEEMSAIAQELSEIINIIDALEEVNTEAVDRMVSPGGLINIFREDIVSPSIDLEEALLNTAEKEGAFFRVPRIIESE